MMDDSPFNFPIPNQPEGRLISAQEAERLLLARLEKCEVALQDTLWDLAFFYSREKQQLVAQKYLERFIAITSNPEKRAMAYLRQGQLMEQMKNFEAAISFYTQTFSLEPENTLTWYLINNNLGFCLNLFDRFAEAENYCRSAIKIDPERHNAYKNLGISLAGQGQYAEASLNYIKAAMVAAVDQRALKLLEQLYAEHPEISNEIPDIDSQIKKCQDAFKEATDIRRKKGESK